MKRKNIFTKLSALCLSGILFISGMPALTAHAAHESVSVFKPILEYSETDYTGTERCPSVLVQRNIQVEDSEGKKQTVTIDLTENEDYTVSYGNNVNAGTGYVYIKGIGEYFGTTSKTFSIKKVNIENIENNVSYAFTKSYIYTGSAIQPNVTVKWQNKTLKLGTDYDVSYSNNTKAGQAYFTVSGKGNFTGSHKEYFTITPQQLKAPRFASASNVAASGTSSYSSTKPGVKLTWYATTNATNYNIYRKKGNGWKKIESVRANTTDTKFTYLDTSVKNGKTYTYRIEAYTTDGNTISATSNSITTYYMSQIQKPTVTALKGKKINVSWEENNKVTGFEVRYKVGKTEKIKKVTKKSQTSVTIKKLKANKKYKVYVRSYKKVGKKTYYSAWSKGVSVRVKK